METHLTGTSNIRTVITPQHILSLWIIQLGLLMGQIIFAGVIYIIHLSRADYPSLPQSGTTDLMIISTIVVGCVAMLCYVLVFLTYRFSKIFIKISNMQKYSSSNNNIAVDSDCAGLLMMKLRVILIVRLVLLETPSIFGLVVILVGVENGTIYEQLDFLINALPMTFFVLYALITFPTQERVITQLEQMTESI